MRFITRSAVVGFLAGVVLVESLTLLAMAFLEVRAGEAVVAVGTAALAAATFWLALEARADRGQSREQHAETIAELRESRFVEILPMLRWQSPTCGVYPFGAVMVVWAGQELRGPWELAIDVLCTNEGPGPARLLDVTLVCDTGELFRTSEIDVPSTIGSGVRLEPFKTRLGPVETVEYRTRRLGITVRYGDLLGEFEYETHIVIEAAFSEKGCTARLLDSDERSALERRLPRRREGA